MWTILSVKGLIGLIENLFFIAIFTDCITSCANLQDGNYASCQACKFFATCSNSILTDRRPCPANLLWNDGIKSCDQPNNVNCGSS